MHPAKTQFSLDVCSVWSQSLRCVLNGKLMTQGFFMWTVTTADAQADLSLLSAQVILLVHAVARFQNMIQFA